MAATEAIGEVIAAGTRLFTAQCPRALLHLPPAFGALVRIVPGSAAAQSAESRAEAQSRKETHEPQTFAASSNIAGAGNLSAANAFDVSAPIDDPFADVPAPSAGLPPDVPDETLYAIVFSAATGSAEPGRRPTAYGLDEEQLRHEQPQIFDLLATEFSALLVGYARGGRFHAGLPPRPARLHAAVSDCSSREVCAVTETPDLLRALINSPADVPTDELIVACIRNAHACRNDDYRYLVRAGKQLAALLREDPDRLTALLSRLEP